MKKVVKHSAWEYVKEKAHNGVFHHMSEKTTSEKLLSEKTTSEKLLSAKTMSEKLQLELIEIRRVMDGYEELALHQAELIDRLTEDHASLLEGHRKHGTMLNGLYNNSTRKVRQQIDKVVKLEAV